MSHVHFCPPTTMHRCARFSYFKPLSPFPPASHPQPAPFTFSRTLIIKAHRSYLLKFSGSRPESKSRAAQPVHARIEKSHAWKEWVAGRLLKVCITFEAEHLRSLHSLFVQLTQCHWHSSTHCSFDWSGKAHGKAKPRRSERLPLTATSPASQERSITPQPVHIGNK